MLCCFRLNQMLFCLSLSFSSAQLLCQDSHVRECQENCHLFQERYRSQRRNNVRLQIPDRGRKNTLFMWSATMQGHFELTLSL